PQALLRLTDIEGKRAVAPIGESEELVSWKLTEDDLFPGAGESYYGFEVTEVQAVNNMVRRGDRVDVWVEYNEPLLEQTSDDLLDKPMEQEELEQPQRNGASSEEQAGLSAENRVSLPKQRSYSASMQRGQPDDATADGLQTSYTRLLLKSIKVAN